MTDPSSTKKSRLRSWAIALAAIGTLALGLWQGGSYGPFEVTVNTPGRNLDQVVVWLYYRTPDITGHGALFTYSETLVGSSNKPIRFPRRFVCLCFRPVLQYGAWHPAFVQVSGIVRSRQFGVSRSNDGHMIMLRDHVESSTPESELVNVVDSHLYFLQQKYAAHAQPTEPLVNELTRGLRNEIASLAIPEIHRANFMTRIDQLEATLRSRAQRDLAERP
jgi:hypothetical protein